MLDCDPRKDALSFSILEMSDIGEMDVVRIGLDGDSVGTIEAAAKDGIAATGVTAGTGNAGAVAVDGRFMMVFTGWTLTVGATDGRGTAAPTEGRGTAGATNGRGTLGSTGGEVWQTPQMGELQLELLMEEVELKLLIGEVQLELLMVEVELNPRVGLGRMACPSGLESLGE